MKRTLIPCMMFLLCLSLQAQDGPKYRRTNLTAIEGEQITIPLPLASGLDRWETRLITRDVLTLVSTKNLTNRVEILLKASSPGMGRLEAVLIRQNTVLERVYYFVRVERKKTGKTGVKDGGVQLPPVDDTKKESPGEKEFSVARNMFQQGFYEESARYFGLFRKQYPQSPLVGRARVYEGQALYSAKKYTQALAALRNVSGSAEVKQLAALWEGHVQDALGADALAVEAFLRALLPGGDEEVSIRARTGLALHYARKGKYHLARMQFRLLFSGSEKDQSKNSGYVLALYYAARMYDRTPVIRDIDRAYDYYSKFLTLSAKLLTSLKDPGRVDFFRRLQQDAAARQQYLKVHFIDFR